MVAWKYRRRRYRGAQALELEAGGVRAVVLPAWGGKIASLGVALGGREPVELLYQPISPEIAPPERGGRFSGEYSWGWDDMFPTIAPCAYGLPPFEGLRLSDHGEIWSGRAVVSREESGCILRNRGRALPYRLEKVLSPLPGGVRITWTLDNQSDDELEYLWAAHPLFAVENDSFFTGPSGDILVAYETPAGRTAEALRRDGLNRMPREEDHSALKYFYRSPVMGGQLPIELHRPSAGIVIRMTFDVKILRFLGVWLNAKGWEDQYTMALEPATGIPDSLEEARENRTSRILAPRSQESWWMELRVNAPSSGV